MLRTVGVVVRAQRAVQPATPIAAHVSHRQSASCAKRRLGEIEILGHLREAAASAEPRPLLSIFQIQDSQSRKTKSTEPGSHSTIALPPENLTSTTRSTVNSVFFGSAML